MMSDRDRALNALLPLEPEPGQIVVMPEGQSAGSAHAIFIYKGEDLIGSASSFAPSETVAKTGMLSRVSTNTGLKKGDTIRIIYSQYDFTSVIFVDYFGWMGDEYYNAVTVYNRFFEVLHVFPIGVSQKNFNLYERVCLQAIEPPPLEGKGDHEDEQGTTTDSTGSTATHSGPTSSPTARNTGHKRRATTPVQGAK